MNFIIFATAVALAFPALAGAPEKFPHRISLDIVSPQSLPTLQTCISRQIGMIVTPVPIEGGVALDLSATPGYLVMTVEIRDRNSERHITIAYRHPFSEKVARKLFGDAYEKCSIE